MQLTSTSSAPAPTPPLPVRAGEHGEPHVHAVRFYESEEFLAAEIAEYVAAGLANGEPVIVVATETHRAAVATRLAALGHDVADAERSGRLRMLDARTTLSTFMSGRAPDERRFRAVLGGVIGESLAQTGSASARAYGEMVDLLWKDGNAEGALRLEALWNDLARVHRFSLLCAYALSNFADAADAERFRAVCDQHSHVLPTERYTEVDDEARAREIGALQQRARALETELARREVMERRLRELLVEQRRAQAALARSERQLRALFESAAEGIHLVGPDGVVLWANRAELDLLGYAADEYIGRHIAEFHVDRDVIDDMLGRLTRGETLRGREARMRRKDGAVRHVLVNSNVLWEDGKFVHTRCFTRDITPLKEAAEERERLLERERAARAEAQAANRAKSEFLAVMSHELRTPLNAIAGYADLLEFGVHGPLTDAQHEAVVRIQRSQRHLLGLIDEVLNYARVESGTVRYSMGPVVLDEVLRTTDALILPQMRAKEIAYQFVGCDRALIAHADAERVQQILLNLLSNAAKFTERGGSVWVECEASGDRVAVRVCDTGVGIAPEKLGAVFEPFVQIDTRLTRAQDGVGLGLAISRDLARGMGGDLTVESTPGVGSTFTLTLPRVAGVARRGVTSGKPALGARRSA